MQVYWTEQRTAWFDDSEIKAFAKRKGISLKAAAKEFAIGELSKETSRLETSSFTFVEDEPEPKIRRSRQSY